MKRAHALLPTPAATLRDSTEAVSQATKDKIDELRGHGGPGSTVFQSSHVVEEHGGAAANQAAAGNAGALWRLEKRSEVTPQMHAHKTLHTSLACNTRTHSAQKSWSPGACCTSHSTTAEEATRPARCVFVCSLSPVPADLKLSA